MTTRIHIVNFGPEPIDVKSANGKQRIYSQQSVDTYVYDDVVVKEVTKAVLEEESKCFRKDLGCEKPRMKNSLACEAHHHGD
jgi:hypothetical protein